MRTETVRRFYERTPFPGQAPHVTLEALRACARRNAFARSLDAVAASDARIVEVGCGTGQMCLFLARAERVVIGADLARASLRMAAAMARRGGVSGVQFVETDLQRPGLKAASFDLVYSAGVLHHTQDPRASFSRVARLARPGGIIVVGVYNAYARLPVRLRRLVALLSGFRFVPFDSVLHGRDGARREAWLRDQYQHPEEHGHTVAEVQDWFAANDLEFVRCYPSTLLDDEPGDLLAPVADDWPFESWLAQLGWMWTLGREGGLFFCIGRRRA